MSRGSMYISQSPPTVHSVGPVGPDGVVRCFHDKEASRFTSRTDNNDGRDFYSCALSRNDPENCGFFKWADELKFPTISLTPSPFPSQGLIAPSSPPMRSEPSRSSQPTRRAPTSAKLTAEQRAKRDAAIVAALSPSPSTLLANVPPADTSIPGPSTPSASSKRRFSPSFHSRNTLASSTLSDDARARREAAIASGLSPPTLPSREISEGKHAAVQTDGTDWSSSAEDEEFDYSNEDVFGPMTANYPSIAMSDNEEPPDAREPAQKKFRGFIQNEESTPSRKSGATASQSVLGLDGQGSTRNVSGMLPTPPRDVRYAPNEDMDAQRDDLVTSSAQSGSKGKERERGGATQWDKIHDDLENPFRHGANSLFPKTSEQAGSSGSTQYSPTSPQPKSCTDSVSAALTLLSNVPDEIRKLERKLAASEQSQRVKSMRIRELEMEIQGLKDKNRLLQESARR